MTRKVTMRKFRDGAWMYVMAQIDDADKEIGKEMIEQYKSLGFEIYLDVTENANIESGE